MAEGKNSFVLYTDNKELWEEISDEQAGRLIKHIFRYVNDENPDAPDTITNLLFIPIKNTLKRDLKKWEVRQKQRVDAAKASVESRKNAKRKEEKETSVNERSISSGVSGSVSGSVSVTETVSSNDDDVYKNIDDLFKRYLSNDKLVKAVLANNSIKNETELCNRLKTFHKALEEKGDTSKTWKDYTSHFIYWHKKTDQIKTIKASKSKMQVL